jgi:hypothetical protein
MNTPPHLPAPARPKPNWNSDSAREVINDLGRIYLEAGLPLAAAFEAAMADYECNLETQELCPV